ncbi:linear amide C-N hydrolase [Bacteroidota bacterium]
MNYRMKMISFFLVMLLLSCTKCVENSATQVPADNDPDNLTLASLEKLDDYPFYTMIYYGDYNFAARASRTENFQTYRQFSDADRLPFGCTCFTSLENGNEILLGRNFDWDSSIPLLLYTDPPVGYASVSIVDIEFLDYTRQNLPDNYTDRSNLLEAPWWPFDGMNEMGVAIGMMAVPNADAPFDPSKITLGEIEAIRLVLDFAASTEEAIQLMGEYNIQMETPPIHYLITDRNSESAVIEFVNDEMVVIRNEEPWQVSTNFIINGSGAPEGSTCWRYNSAYSQLQEAGGAITSTNAMDILQSVSSSTKWSAVYDVISGDIKVAAGMNYNRIYTFNMNEFNR